MARREGEKPSDARRQMLRCTMSPSSPSMLGTWPCRRHSPVCSVHYVRAEHAPGRAYPAACPPTRTHTSRTRNSSSSNPPPLPSLRVLRVPVWCSADVPLFHALVIFVGQGPICCPHAVLGPSVLQPPSSGAMGYAGVLRNKLTA